MTNKRETPNRKFTEALLRRMFDQAADWKTTGGNCSKLWKSALSNGPSSYSSSEPRKSIALKGEIA